MTRPLSDRALISIVGTIQFINIIDFMMVMPLGPDYALALGIATSNIGVLGASYSAAAAISALLVVGWLDRFDRRTVVTFAMLGLAAGTAAGALATDMNTLLAARIVAGTFGGPATSMAMTLIIDQVAPERRGRALGAVMGAFSVASVLGVPAALELAHWGDWRTPFIVVSLLGALVALAARLLLPPIHGHVLAAQQRPIWGFLSLFTRSTPLLAYSATGAAMLAGFLIIPNISAFVQFNLGYPREHLGLLYLAGGGASFFTMRAAGRYVDKYGSVPVAWVGTGLLLICLLFGFVWRTWPLPVLAIYILFMVAMSTRNIASTALISHVPQNFERAGFMSVNSAVQNLAAALGAAASALLLSAEASGALIGMSRAGLLAMLCATAVPLLLLKIQRRVRHAAMAPGVLPE
ncbi:MAG: MFS transporter [Gammaproteobacteria bacterium]|nr:MFS transporter [Gammaproteobacteria bacterium]